ncbi:MAG: Fe-S cluster assembly ATP-binding protein [Gammaproteobacteria bacterium]
MTLRAQWAVINITARKRSEKRSAHCNAGAININAFAKRNTMLSVIDLHVSVGGQPILKGLNLQVNAGEVHAIMGPNGSGKSTLCHVLSGRDGYEVTSGQVTYNGEDLLALAPDERAHRGVFLAFQYPVEIPGVNNTYFLRAAANAVRRFRGQEELDAFDFMQLVRDRLKVVKMNESLLKRAVNEGFSGGEKKRNEIFQMAVLEPTLALLDETDSGLDIDALRIVSEGVNSLRDANRGFIVVTHYQRLLNHIVPDFVHVLLDGRISASGDRDLALRLENEGYETISREANA